jgi:hypothetical protein
LDCINFADKDRANQPHEKKQSDSQSDDKPFFEKGRIKEDEFKIEHRPKIMNAMRAADGNVTKVAAMNASEVLQSVSIPASVIIEMIERTESDAKGRITR